MFTCGEGHLSAPREPAARVPVRIRSRTYRDQDRLRAWRGHETVEERLFCPKHADVARRAYARMVQSSVDGVICGRHLHVVFAGITGSTWRLCTKDAGHPGPCGDYEG
jgi:hypothetical protein